MNIKFSGVDKLAKELKRLNSIRFNGVCEKQVGEIYDRAQKNFKEAGEGTPVGEYVGRREGGELRKSSTTDGKNEVGYTEKYAAHVEYGHRTRGGGFVPGQYYFKNNVDKQREIFETDLINELLKGK